MAIEAVYCNIGDVKSALDVKASAYADRRILRAIRSGARNIDSLCQRKFYPKYETRYFDWPNFQHARSWVLWLEQHEVISVTTVTSGGTEITSSQYLLEPNGEGPPYDRIEIDLSTSAAWTSGSTPQRSIAVLGQFGHSADTTLAGALAEALDATETGVDITDSTLLDAGDTLLIDTEYMLINSRSMLDTGITIDTGGDLTAAVNDVTVACSTTTGQPAAGELILIGAERMLVQDVAGSNLTVQRAYDGTVLAAHSAGAAIYCPRTLNVTRGALGTTAATHDTATAAYKHTPPGPVIDLNIAEAIMRIQQEEAGYARTVGAGDGTRNASMIGLASLRNDVYEAYARQLRSRSI